MHCVLRSRVIVMRFRSQDRVKIFMVLTSQYSKFILIQGHKFYIPDFGTVRFWNQYCGSGYWSGRIQCVSVFQISYRTNVQSHIQHYNIQIKFVSLSLGERFWGETCGRNTFCVRYFFVLVDGNYHINNFIKFASFDWFCIKIQYLAHNPTCNFEGAHSSLNKL
jgi:hypothetical protein